MEASPKGLWLPAGLGLGTAAGAVLVAASLILTPSALTASPEGSRGLIAVAVILAVYAGAGWGWVPRLPLEVQQAGQWGGLLAAGVFAVEIILEYVLLPADNTPYGLAEFGLVFLIFLGVGAVLGYRAGGVRPAVAGAVGAALLSSLAWLAVVLAVTLALRGTAAQAQVFAAEGNLEDFRRSGMTDYAAFIVQDLLGAGFFHLLLGPLSAALLGALGGLLGRMARRLRRP